MSGVGTHPRMLRRADEIGIGLRSDGTCTLTVGNRQTSASSHALAILDAFSAPRPYEEALGALGAAAKGPADWIALTACFQSLVRRGVLIDDHADERASHAACDTSGLFAQAPVHVAMLDDTFRTSAFLRAIQEVVGPEDIVVDIGTGTGILAVGAAQAGARHVFAIEATRMADAAAAVFEANGLADRISLVRGWSTRVTLPERATVLVAEILGDEPLAEDGLLITWDARRRLLSEDARMIPRAVTLHAVPVEIPSDVVEKRFFTVAQAARWRELYGIELGTLVGFGAPATMVAKHDEARGWQPLSPAVALPEIDFRVSETTLELCARGTFDRDGPLGGVTLYFNLDLAPGVSLSTSPWADEAVCWGSPTWLLPGHPPVRRGQAFEIRYRFTKPRGKLTLRLL